MSEVSTRVWLDEGMWEAIADRARREGTTVRELIPRLVKQGLMPPRVVEREVAPRPDAPPSAPLTEARTSVIPLADVYRCAVCDAEVRLGGLSYHLGKHMKEQQAAESERS